jgi:biotin carboxyl carrier protein
MKTTFNTQTIEINPSGDKFFVLIDDKKYQIEIIRVNLIHNCVDFKITELSESVFIGESVIESAYISSDGAKRWVTINGETILLTKTSGAKQNVRHDHAGGLIAPMPGQVRSVAVSVGDVVKQGQTLLTMEAMKMEIKIQALLDGKIKSVFVSQGDTVEREQILIEVEE